MLGVKTKMPPRVLNAFNFYYETRSIKETAELANLSENTIRKHRKLYKWDNLVYEIDKNEAIKKATDSNATLTDLSILAKELIRVLSVDALVKLNNGEIKASNTNDLSKILTMLKDYKAIISEGESVSDNDNNIEVSLTVNRG